MNEDKWQPIETAPKDGTHVLLLTSNQIVVEGFWAEDAINFYKSQKGWASYDPENAKGEWIAFGSREEDPRMYCGDTPQFWMPLPPLPTPPEGQSE